MTEIAKGSKTDLRGTQFTVRIDSTQQSGHNVDVAATLLGPSGKVRSDADFVFFNNPAGAGVTLVSDAVVEVDLARVPAEVDRVLVTASTEAIGTTFGAVAAPTVHVVSDAETMQFRPSGLTTETVLQAVAFYRRGQGWRLDAVGQGYSGGLAAFAAEHGIDVDDPGTPPAVPAPPAPPAAAPPEPTSTISFSKVKVALTKDSPEKKATIDLRKSQGDPSWVLTVGLEWDGRGATYDRNGQVKRFGKGDLDVYFFCRNEETNNYVVISGEKGHRGSLDAWPFMHHDGDSKGPGARSKPATEQVRVRPQENGDLLVNVYQSVDNGGGAINTFGKPRVAIRYGRMGVDGLPGPDADEVLVFIGNDEDSYWATVAHVDVQDGILTVDGETRYSEPGEECMPGLDTAGGWVREPKGGPVGRSKRANKGIGLTRYAGKCPPPAK
ncbi:TerD family protein [Rhodococcus sp. X156]|uniref:TerD family protein n=1 Tax=Rhodococcus sp. X156 TaxID=2499145 RepID=UPI000FDADCBF|nr:TerD family protein [Rhodococcus sp. X156]